MSMSFEMFKRKKMLHTRAKDNFPIFNSQCPHFPAFYTHKSVSCCEYEITFITKQKRTENLQDIMEGFKMFYVILMCTYNVLAHPSHPPRAHSHSTHFRKTKTFSHETKYLLVFCSHVDPYFLGNKHFNILQS